MQKLRVAVDSKVRQYPILIGHGVLGSVGTELRRAYKSKATRIAIISNEKVFSLYGSRVLESLQQQAFDVSQFLIGDGERFKTMKTLAAVLSFLAEQGFQRSDAVLALGGGVVGDVAGFAAASYLRGIGFFQAPTTVLAQIDSSVGGKTGVNLPQGKNLIGSFYQPHAVFIDTEVLRTLPQRELTSGWCEMVKNGVVGGCDLLKQTTEFLQRQEVTQPFGLEKLIAAHCAFKAAVVKGDEREDINRNDARSRRILNFGHTVGHAIESVTHYRRFRHGEAVGYGMLAAVELSKSLNLLPQSDVESIREAVASCGSLPLAVDLDERAIISALNYDKKKGGAHIQWVLLKRIGKPLIVNGGEISSALVRDAVRTALNTRSKSPGVFNE